LAKKVRAPRLVREIDWVDNFWNFPGGKMNVVDEKKAEANSVTAEPVTDGGPTTNGKTDAITAPAANGTEVKPKGRAPSSWPKVQLYCLVSSDNPARAYSRWA
jgi:F-box/leucine-rich repeat protein 10/11